MRKVILFICGVFLCLPLLGLFQPAHAATVPVSWGHNGSGQLGDGTNFRRLTPVQVSGLTGVTAIAGGFSHSVALKSDGTVWTWGNNSNGELGDGTTTARNVPVRVNLTGVTTISAGSGHTAAIKDDGSVWTWGSNNLGQLGDGTVIDRHVPTKVTGITDAIAISCAHGFTVAATNDGSVWTWGVELRTRGNQTTNVVPVQINDLSDVIAVSAFESHAATLKRDGTIWSWGWNDLGQLGDGTTTDRITPVQAQGVTDAIAISSGYSRTVALMSNGTVWAWGVNSQGEVGDGTTENRLTPVQVYGLTGITAISSNAFHTAALKSDGTVWAWGHNGYGELGDGTTSGKISPVLVSRLSGVTAIGAGGFHTLAITSAFNVSGRISDARGTAMSGARVMRNGSATPVFTNSAGYYTFINVPVGIYTITPQHNNTHFMPPGRTVTVATANVSGQNFVGATGYNVHGRLADTSGRGLAGINVYRSGHSTPEVTNSAGYYTFINVPNGSVTIRPVAPGRAFLPESRTLNINGANINNQNFTSVAPRKIMGRIATSSGQPMAGVTVTRSGSSTPVTTNSAGYYTFNDVPNGAYTITASKTGIIFTPATRTVNVKDADEGAQNFIGSG